MSYITWTVVAVLALAALIGFLFVPGAALFAALALGLAVVLGIVLLIARGGTIDASPDVVERRDEHRGRRRRRSR